MWTSVEVVLFMVQVVLFEEGCYRYCTILIPFCILFIADAPE